MGADVITPAVIFDLDGVIVDSEELQYRAYREVLAEYGVDVSRQEYGREWIANGNGPEYAVKAYRLAVDAETLRERKNPLYHQILRREARLMPGAADAVQRLASQFPLAVATNSGEADTGYVLDHFELRGHFAAVITRESYHAPKPAPDAFLAASTALGVAPGNCVVLEDAYKGVVAASRAGCPCVAVPHELTRDNDFRLATTVVGALEDVTVALIRSLVTSDAQVRTGAP